MLPTARSLLRRYVYPGIAVAILLAVLKLASFLL